MSTNYIKKEGDNIYEFLKNNIKIETVADKLAIKLTKHGDELVGMCPSGPSIKQQNSFEINSNEAIILLLQLKNRRRYN